MTKGIAAAKTRIHFQDIWRTIYEENIAIHVCNMMCKLSEPFQFFLNDRLRNDLGDICFSGAHCNFFPNNGLSILPGQIIDNICSIFLPTKKFLNKNIILLGGRLIFQICFLNTIFIPAEAVPEFFLVISNGYRQRAASESRLYDDRIS